MIQVALIPPVGWEQYLKQSTGVQMSLALEECMENPTYANAFRTAAANGDLVIVDNGAAEGKRSRGKVVVDFARSLNASEVVLPDVLGNRKDTQLRVAEFFTSRANYWPDLKYMGVVHGQNLRELQASIHYYACLTVIHPNAAERHVLPVTTLGFPRIMCGILSNPSARIDLANWTYDQYPDLPIHFLGAWFAWPQELKYATRYTQGNVRSIDTSLPFNYAIDGRLLQPQGPRTPADNVDRHPEYLMGTLINRYERLVNQNIATYLNWATLSTPTERQEY